MTVKVSDQGMLVHDAKYNLCDKKLKPDMVRSNIVGWAIPNRCPVNESAIFCQNGKKVLTLSLITQRMFALFSTSRSTKIEIIINHDTGISCFEADTKIIKEHERT